MVEETFPRTLVSWAIATIAVLATLVGVGRLLLGPRWFGLVMIVVAAVAAYISLQRIRHDCAHDIEQPDFLREIEELDAQQEKEAHDHGAQA